MPLRSTCRLQSLLSVFVHWDADMQMAATTWLPIFQTQMWRVPSCISIRVSSYSRAHQISQVLPSSLQEGVRPEKSQICSMQAWRLPGPCSPPSAPDRNGIPGQPGTLGLCRRQAAEAVPREVHARLRGEQVLRHQHAGEGC